MRTQDLGSKHINYVSSRGKYVPREIALIDTDATIEPMGFWIRLIAIVIDIIIISAARYPITLIFWALSDDFLIWGGLKRGSSNIGLNILYITINLAIFFAYFIIMDVRYHATLGKTLFRLEVVGIDLLPIRYREAILRETIGKAISLFACFLGFIWAGFDARKQAWHDKIAGTYVIRRNVEH